MWFRGGMHLLGYDEAIYSTLTLTEIIQDKLTLKLSVIQYNLADKS